MAAGPFDDPLSAASSGFFDELSEGAEETAVRQHGGDPIACVYVQRLEDRRQGTGM